MGELKERQCDGESCECEVGYDVAQTYQCEHCVPEEYKPAPLTN